MKFLTSYGVAFILILIIGIWMLSGTIIHGGRGEGEGEKQIIQLSSNSDKNETSPLRQAQGEEAIAKGEGTISQNEEVEKELQNVRTQMFIAQEMPIEVALRGRTKANATISATAQTSGTLEQIHVKKGDFVKKGTPLCTLDSGTKQAQLNQATAALAQAKASLTQAQANYETNKTLREKGLAASNTKNNFEVQLEAAKSALAGAKASLDFATLELEHITINAQIDGLVQSPIANVGDMIRNGGICATIVQLDPMLFVGKVAEAKVGLLKEGMSAKIQTINLPPIKGFANFEGKVRYISAIADEATRSFDVEIEFNNPNLEIRSGQTANARIFVGKTKAHLIAQSSLTLDDDGDIGVKIVDENNKVHFVKVQILRDTTKGVFVSGLPDKAQIIIFGQEYVIDNQKVDATLVTKDISS